MLPLPLFLVLACNAPLPENEPPNIKIITPADQSEVSENGTTFRILIRDRDGDNSMNVVVTSDIDGELFKKDEVENGEELSFDTVLSAATHQITVTADDGQFEGLRTTVISVTVDQSPTPFTVSITPEVPTGSTNMVGTLTSASTDPEGLSIVYKWEWSSPSEANPLTGTEVGEGWSASVSSNLIDKGEQWTFSVQACESTEGVEPDEDGSCTTISETVEIGNQPPNSLTNVTIVPPSPLAHDNLKCLPQEPLPLDPDLDDLTYEYEWEVDDGSGFTTSPVTDQQIDASLTREGDVWRCAAYPFDGEARGAGAIAETTVGERIIFASAAPIQIAGSEPDTEVGAFAAGVSLDTSGGTDVAVTAYDYLALGDTVHVIRSVINGDLESLNSLKLSGSSDTDRPGTPLIRIPDLTQDGAAELAVGVPGLSDPAVYVIPSLSVSGSVDITGTGTGFISLVHADPSSDDGFGATLAGGDVSGDGLADVLVGQIDPGAANSVWVFPGGQLQPNQSSTTNQTSARLVGPTASDLFGTAVDAGADVDGNGTNDVIVADVSATSGEAAWVYFDASLGGTVNTGSADIVIETSDASELGHQVALIPDLNGDGFGEIVVSAPNRVVSGDAVGAVYVFFGSDSLSGPLTVSDADTVLFGNDEGDRFGERILVLGDRGVDGLAELVVAAPGATVNTEAVAGKVFHYLGADLAAGGAIQANDAALQVWGDTAGGELTIPGHAGDIDGDGVIDWMVGAPTYDGTNTAEGRLYIFPSNH